MNWSIVVPGSWPLVEGLAAAVTLVFYGVHARPRLAEDFFVARVGAVYCGLRERVESGALSADDVLVVNFLALLDAAARDPHGALTLLRRCADDDLTARFGVAVGVEAPTRLGVVELDALDGPWREFSEAAGGLAVDGTPWWPVRRFSFPGELDLPLASLLTLQVDSARPVTAAPAGDRGGRGPEV